MQYKSQEQQWKNKRSDKLQGYYRISKESLKDHFSSHRIMAKTLRPSSSLSSSATIPRASGIINYFRYVCVTLAFLAALLNMQRMPNIDIIADDQSIIPSVMVAGTTVTNGEKDNRKMTLLNKGKENENQIPSKDNPAQGQSESKPNPIGVQRRNWKHPFDPFSDFSFRVVKKHEEEEEKQQKPRSSYFSSYNCIGTGVIFDGRLGNRQCQIEQGSYKRRRTDHTNRQCH